jgi:uncharacterized protein (TIGR02391 family)
VLPTSNLAASGDNVGMSDVYGYDREDFLELEPDEIAGAILPSLRQHPAQISLWNTLMESRQAHDDEIANRVAEGLGWLVSEGYLTLTTTQMDWYRLSRRGLAADLAAHVADSRAVGLLRAARLDNELASQVMPTFRRGQYDQAVFAAFRVVEDRVRHHSQVANEVGAKLMRAAFGQGASLADPGLDRGEINGRADLFAGAMGVHRNATGHQIVNYADPQEAAEAVLLANNLLRHLERAVQATRGRGRPRARQTREP